MGPRGRVRSLRGESKQKRATIKDRGQHRQLDQRRGRERAAGPRFSREPRHRYSSELDPALDFARNARLFARGRFYRDRRFHFAVAFERELHSLRARAVGQAGLLLARDRDGSAPDLRARRNSRSLLPTLLILEAREPDSPSLL